jgi:galactose mutarotase-like enzyme
MNLFDLREEIIMISKTSWNGEQAVLLSSDTSSAVILPKRGGKIASFYNKKKNFEFLFQNPKSGYTDAAIGDSFEDFEACGFDDAFPTLIPETVMIDGNPVHYPDHGEIWSAPFDLTMHGEKAILNYQSNLLGYTYQKQFQLSDQTLHGSWRIENQSDIAFPYLWAFHCLSVYRKNMQILFPKGTEKIMNGLHSKRLGNPGAIYTFPEDTPFGIGYDFTRVPQPESESYEKYFVWGKVREGRIGYRFPDEQTAIQIQYDPQIFPYLGFWVTAGGFRGDYNCALEPMTSFYDSVANAEKSATLRFLNPGESIHFDIDITFLDTEND